MPFQSEKQRRYLWKNEPKIAKAWAHGKSSVTGKKESGKESERSKVAKQLARKGLFKQKS